jgi:hypothetical protein
MLCSALKAAIGRAETLIGNGSDDAVGRRSHSPLAIF